MLWEELLRSVPPSLADVAHSLSRLCQRIETLSTQSVLHPSKIRCLAKSYSVLVFRVLSLTFPSSSSSSFPPRNLPALLTALLHTLQAGERFIQDCTFQAGNWWFIPGSARKQRQWLINKAIFIALSTEIFDVHLHDLVWCISSLICVLSNYRGALLDVRIQANRVHALLKETWALADEENDIKSMQELFNKIGPKGHERICHLICHRLSERTSKAKLNLTDAVVPTYLWMDSQGFENMHDHVLGSNELVVVFETRLMGGRFACKHFHRPGYEEVFKYEAVVQARLRHANVVHLVCCTKRASEGKTCSLVMELMHQDLGSLIAKRRLAGMDGPFSLLAGVDLMLQIARGMEYLHDLGIMHRDLKSFNILVSHSQHASYLDERGHMIAKISDFGTSKVKQDSSMYTTKHVGTSIWRAPEVVDDEDEAKYTKKADVYSFAIVCAEILTGLPPHELLPCNRRSELPKLLKEGRRPELPSSCPPAISSYIEKCWHGDASERPTFNQICTLFRVFKACILLEETEMLESPLQDDIIDFEELRRTAAEGQSEGMFYHPVLDIPSEMHILRSIWEQNSSKRSELEHQGLKQLLRRGQGTDFSTEYADASRYKIQKIIGKGSHSVVCSAIDTHTGEMVAIKKSSHIFEHISDATRILREIKILRILQHPDIVEIKHIMLPPPGRDFKEIFVVFELMESGLHHVIKANDDLTPEHHRFFLYQLLRALKYIHTANVYHRDLNPKNVLANSDCKLKICDFGSARMALNDLPARIFWTDYVASRWYRAPELCGSFFYKYTPAIDIWSIGCIFAEILTGKPLFPGKNIVHQLDLITDLLGTPSPDVIERIRNEKARRYLISMPEKPPLQFSKKFANADPLALRLLEKLLAFNPNDRPSAEEALADPYFKGIANIQREPSCGPISKVEFEFERRRVYKEDVRELIYREILEYHPHMLKEYLSGRSNFLYTSAMDQFGTQFSHLEDGGIIPLNRPHASSPRL